MKHANLRAALVAALLLAAPGVHAAEAKSGMTPFLPPPPAGWSSPMGPNATEDENGLEPMVSQGYGPSKPGEPGALTITLTHPSAHDMAVRFSDMRLGPNPFAPQFVVSRVKVNDLDAFLTYDATDRGGVLEMKVGRVLVGIQGGQVSADQIIAFASSIDTARLLKY